jgi:hypothetical protein
LLVGYFKIARYYDPEDKAPELLTPTLKERTKSEETEVWEERLHLSTKAIFSEHDSPVEDNELTGEVTL